MYVTCINIQLGFINLFTFSILQVTVQNLKILSNVYLLCLDYDEASQNHIATVNLICDIYIFFSFIQLSI